MIDWKEVPEEERGRIISEVAERRETYRGKGIDTLTEMVMSAKIFESIEPKDSEEVACRNFVLSLMEGMDLVNEKTLPLILEYMLEMPIGN